MKNYKDIKSIMGYILKKHQFVGKQNVGGYGIVTFRKKDGIRNIIQQLKYFRIFKYSVHDDNTVLIHNMITGISFDGKQIQSSSSVLYLPDLIQINVYDNGTHFFTDSGIDFGYVMDSYSVVIRSLRAWIDDQSPVLRAQWRNSDKSSDLLDKLTFRNVITIPRRKRNLRHCQEIPYVFSVGDELA